MAPASVIGAGVGIARVVQEEAIVEMAVSKVCAPSYCVHDLPNVGKTLSRLSVNLSRPPLPYFASSKAELRRYLMPSRLKCATTVLGTSVMWAGTVLGLGIGSGAVSGMVCR